MRPVENWRFEKWQFEKFDERGAGGRSDSLATANPYGNVNENFSLNFGSD